MIKVIQINLFLMMQIGLVAAQAAVILIGFKTKAEFTASSSGGGAFYFGSTCDPVLPLSILIAGFNIWRHQEKFPQK